MNEFERGIAALMLYRGEHFKYKINHIERTIQDIESVMINGCEVAQ